MEMAMKSDCAVSGVLLPVESSATVYCYLVDATYSSTGDKDNKNRKKARTEHTAHATMLNKETKARAKEPTQQPTPTTPVKVVSGIN
jgi:hypothetical protein